MKFFFACAGAVVLLACGKGERADSRSTAMKVAAEPAVAAGTVGNTPSRGVVGGVLMDQVQSAPRVAESPEPSQDIPESASSVGIVPSMVIRNGQASVEVDKLDPAIVKIRQLAAQLGGYIANSSMTGGRDQVRTATFEIKMPAQRFDQALNGLNTLGKVESVNATAEDVGEEYVDVTARVANAHRLEDRLVALLATRTGKLQDVLDVERELARVREEIERYEGRLRYLKSRVATSSLTVTLHEPVPILGQNPGQNPIMAAIRQAWRNFVGFIAAVIASLGLIVPIGALIIVAWISYRKLRAKK